MKKRAVSRQPSAVAVRGRLGEATFLELVLHDDLRAELLALVGSRDARSMGDRELVSVVAPKCRATADELRRAVKILDADASDAAASVLADLLFHPDVPEDVLLALAEEGTCVASIAHRRGTPRAVLEVLASKHRYPEAITTLAITHYGAPRARAKPFRAFLERYADVPMLEYNVRRAKLDDAKRRIVLEVFGEER